MFWASGVRSRYRSPVLGVTWSRSAWEGRDQRAGFRGQRTGFRGQGTGFRGQRVQGAGGKGWG